MERESHTVAGRTHKVHTQTRSDLITDLWSCEAVTLLAVPLVHGRDTKWHSDLKTPHSYQPQARSQNCHDGRTLK